MQHPHLAPRLRRDPLLDGADHPVTELIRALVAAAGEDRSVELEELSDQLSDEARSLLYALVADDHPPEESAAAQMIEDTNRWLEQREERALQRDLTERLRRGEADVFEVLRAKQRQRQNPHAPPPTGRSH